jgi:threonine dehydratase
MPVAKLTDLSRTQIEAAAARIDPVFLDTPQFVSTHISAALNREVIIKNETETPIGSFKGRGTSLLGQQLDRERTWVCSTAGNFGQGLAYAARARGGGVEAFVSPEVPAAKLSGMQALGADVHVCTQPGRAACDYAAETESRVLVVDGLHQEMAEGAGTIGLELEALGAIDLAIVQVGDGALISGVACCLKAAQPKTRVVGVCAAGAPAMAKSFAAGRVIPTRGTNTIATAIAVSEPIPESFARVRAFVDEIVLVDDEDLRSAQRLIRQTLAVSVEPAGAAGVAALARHSASLPPGRTAVLLTGAGAT